MVDKSAQSRAAIKVALRTNALFLNMEESQSMETEDSAHPQNIETPLIHILSSLLCVTVNAIIDAMEPMTIPAGGYACKIGEAAKTFYTIETGSLEVYISMIEGGQKILKKQRVIGTGDAFGEAFLFNVKRTATVIAVEESILWGITRNNFRKVLKKITEDEAKEVRVFDLIIAFRFLSRRYFL